MATPGEPAQYSDVAQFKVSGSKTSGGVFVYLCRTRNRLNKIELLNDKKI